LPNDTAFCGAITPPLRFLRPRRGSISAMLATATCFFLKLFSPCKNANHGPFPSSRTEIFLPQAASSSQVAYRYDLVSMMNQASYTRLRQAPFTLLNTCDHIYTIGVSICKAGTGQLSYSCELARRSPFRRTPQTRRCFGPNLQVERRSFHLGKIRLGKIQTRP
jgi:hypothetical protein